MAGQATAAPARPARARTAASPARASSSVQCHATPGRDREARLHVVLDLVDLERTRPRRPRRRAATPARSPRARARCRRRRRRAMIVSAQRGSRRSRASDSRRAASASSTRRGPARTPVETGIACGRPAAGRQHATVPASQSGSSCNEPVQPRGTGGCCWPRRAARPGCAGEPRCALRTIVAAGIACTAHARAERSCRIGCPGPRAWQARARCHAIQDHMQPALRDRAGVAWHWTDEDARAGDTVVRAALDELARR